MGYILTAIFCLLIGAVLMALVSARSRSDELNQVYEQGYKAGCSKTWAQVRKFNRGKYR